MPDVGKQTKSTKPMKCPECGDWRVTLEPKYDWRTESFSDPQLRCYACLEFTDAPKVKLPLSRSTPQ